LRREWERAPLVWARPPHPVRNRLAAMVMAQVKANAFFN